MTLHLKRKDLLCSKAFINGEWQQAASGECFSVTNPATGEVISTVPRLSAQETESAIQAADAALPAWRSKTAKERAVILRRWYELMMVHQEDLAILLTHEQGKSLTEARGEVAYAAAF